MREYMSVEKLKNLSSAQFDFSQNCGQQLRINAESVKLGLQPLWEEIC